jgi:polar amino acid transport system permease protein
MAMTRPPPPAPRRGWTLTDAAILVVLLGLVVWMGVRASENFQYRWNWSSVWPFIIRIDPETGRWAPNVLLQGLLTTIRLALWGMLLATLIGILMGWARTCERLLPRLIAASYVMLVRNIPPVVFVFIFVYFISSHFMPALRLADRVRTWPAEWQTVVELLFGPVAMLDNFLLGLICLSVFSGAYVTEIVRAGLQSVPRQQIEAGQSLGLTGFDQFRFVVLPQAFRTVLPALAGQLIQLIKDSSLVSLVSIQELTFMAQDVQVSTQRVFEVFVLIAVVYFVLCLGLSTLFRRLELRSARGRV